MIVACIGIVCCATVVCADDDTWPAGITLVWGVPCTCILLIGSRLALDNAPSWPRVVILPWRDWANCVCWLAVVDGTCGANLAWAWSCKFCATVIRGDTNPAVEVDVIVCIGCSCKPLEVDVMWSWVPGGSGCLIPAWNNCCCEMFIPCGPECVTMPGPWGCVVVGLICCPTGNPIRARVACASCCATVAVVKLTGGTKPFVDGTSLNFWPVCPATWLTTGTSGGGGGFPGCVAVGIRIALAWLGAVWSINRCCTPPWFTIIGCAKEVPTDVTTFEVGVVGIGKACKVGVVTMVVDGDFKPPGWGCCLNITFGSCIGLTCPCEDGLMAGAGLGGCCCCCCVTWGWFVPLAPGCCGDDGVWKLWNRAWICCIWAVGDGSGARTIAAGWIWICLIDLDFFPPSNLSLANIGCAAAKVTCWACNAVASTVTAGCFPLPAPLPAATLGSNLNGAWPMICAPCNCCGVIAPFWSTPMAGCPWGSVLISMNCPPSCAACACKLAGSCNCWIAPPFADCCRPAAWGCCCRVAVASCKLGIPVTVIAPGVCTIEVLPCWKLVWLPEKLAIVAVGVPWLAGFTLTLTPCRVFGMFWLAPTDFTVRLPTELTVAPGVPGFAPTGLIVSGLIPANCCCGDTLGIINRWPCCGWGEGMTNVMPCVEITPEPGWANPSILMPWICVGVGGATAGGSSGLPTGTLITPEKYQLKQKVTLKPLDS